MHRTSSSTWVKGIADMFASQGVDTPRLFRAARLDVGLLDRPDARVDALMAPARRGEVSCPVCWLLHPEGACDA